ncbi:Imm32 family immunity protein [Amycolatopsis nigrescens]|uniref:Imm32 family immunity protein n=1 Tax=Amycolatopsis nigrescens TaxID=381445 RepID=UPI00035FFB6F|nr:hypothetical protein [Amycolatopsis nigrescens]
MIVEFADTGRETLLAGKPDEYRRVADALQAGAGSFELNTDPAAVRQGSPLSRLDIGTADSDGVVISVDTEDRRLVITGPRQLLSVLADIFRDSAGTGDPEGHVHIEYFPEHFYLDPASMPLTIWDAVD